MNRFFYKTIFNRNTGLMVVVAENACNNGKSSKNKVFQVALFSKVEWATCCPRV
ncbi:MAG: ESPR domain-containing protein [Neisseriaceae bacterium]|nr:ESPR domain-containing protein [Neisseriaceae bacterium]